MKASNSVLKYPKCSRFPLFLLTLAEKALSLLCQQTPIKCCPLDEVRLVKTKLTSTGIKTQESSL